jgi:protein unc-13
MEKKKESGVKNGKSTDRNDSAPPSVAFWSEFIKEMMGVIEEDSNTYAKVLNQFPQELNIGNLSVATLWTKYKYDLKMALEGMNSIEKFIVILLFNRTCQK